MMMAMNAVNEMKTNFTFQLAFLCSLSLVFISIFKFAPFIIKLSYVLACACCDLSQNTVMHTVATNLLEQSAVIVFYN